MLQMLVSNPVVYCLINVFMFLQQWIVAPYPVVYCLTNVFMVS